MVGGVNWGSIPDWLAAGGTTGAFLATLYIILRDRRGHRQVEQEQITQQARLVLVDSDYHERENDGTSFDERRFVVVVQNGSLEPLLDSTIMVEPPRDISAQERSIDQSARSLDVGTIFPGEHRYPMPLPGQWARFATVELLFTDRNGRRWTRRSDGRLERTSR
jgi:hypothetical protein